MKREANKLNFNVMTKAGIEALVFDLQAENDKLKDEKAILNRKVESRDQEIDFLQQALRLERARMYGKSSECFSDDQISMTFNEVESTEYLEKENAAAALVTGKKPRKKADKEKWKRNLQKEEEHFELPKEEMLCPNCDGILHDMKTEIRHEMKYIPAKLITKDFVVHTYSCRACEKHGIQATIITAKAPKPILKKSFVSAEILSHVITEKYEKALPLYRQQQWFEKQGVELTRQTLSNWIMGGTDNHLSKLYELLKKELLKKNILHADETVLQVLKEPGRDASTKSYMWLYETGLSDKPIIIFEYQPGRSGSYPKNFLKDFSGYVHTDGYAGYNILTEELGTDPPSVKLVGCLAHARRKWMDALKTVPKNKQGNAKNINIGICFFKKLFALEKEYLESYFDEERLEFFYAERHKERNKTSKRILDAYFEWVKMLSPSVPTTSPLGQALTYSLNQEYKLREYLSDGRLEISNNKAERAIRPFVIGRKNWLFSNTPAGANSSAIAYSMIETAKANGLNTYEYLKHIFEVMPNLESTDDATLQSLLPWSDELPDSCRLKKD